MPGDTRAQARQQQIVRTVPAMAMKPISTMLARNRIPVNRALRSGSTLLPVQTLAELFSLLVRKAGRTAAQARAAMLTWRDAFPLIDTSPAVMLASADLATDHQLGIWDAVTLSATGEAGCRLLLSEDLNPGFTWKA